jgi:hypothetical protein
MLNVPPQASFPLGEIFRRNRERSKLIGRRPTLTTSPVSPPNHIRVLLFRAEKTAWWKIGFSLS